MQQYRDSHGIIKSKELIVMKNKITQKNKNKSSLRSGVWAVSLLTQLVAIGIIGIIAFSFGVVGVIITGAVAVGYLFLAKATIGLLKGRVTDADSISTLTALHMVAFVLSFFVIGTFCAFYFGMKF